MSALTATTVTRSPRALSSTESRKAAEYGRAARSNQAATAGRAIPASRDDDLVRTTIDTSLVRAAARIIDADPTLVVWLEEKVSAAQSGPGRPAAVSMRTLLMCMWLLNVTSRNSHLINLPALLANLDERVRRNLGIDYLDRSGSPRQVSYHQILRAFNNLADALDPFADGLSDLESAARAADLQEFNSRMLRCSVNHHAHAGDYAVDATLVWAWDRPRTTPSGAVQSLHGKVERRGRDGDNGPPLSLSQVMGTDDGELALEDAGFIDNPIAAVRTEAQAAKSSSTRRTVRRPGAKWVGRGNKAKSVYGYALHTATVTDPNAPAVIEALAVTPAPALPALAVVPLLRSLHDARLADNEVADLAEQGTLRTLGNIVADPAYSQNIHHWQLPIRAMGGSAIYRLRRKSQDGRKAVRGSTFVDGRPYCSCIPSWLANREYPKFPYKRATLESFQNDVVGREPFEMLPNGGYRKNGGRQFRTPHFDRSTRSGGCEHCVDAFGKPVLDPATGRPVPTCCTQQTHTFTGEELGLYQDAAFGTREWADLWNPRNRVEGSYGVMKGLSLVNWGHDYHHFTGLARETLVATFAVMSYNFHIQRTHAARLRLAEEPPARPGSLPSAQPTETLPDAVAIAVGAAKAAEREASPRGPKGLELLGTPRHSGP